MKKSSVFGGNNEVISIKLNLIVPSIGLYQHLYNSPPHFTFSMEKNSKQPSKTPTKRRQSQQLKTSLISRYLSTSFCSEHHSKPKPHLQTRKLKTQQKSNFSSLFSPFYLINISKTQNTLNTC